MIYRDVIVKRRRIKSLILKEEYGKIIMSAPYFVSDEDIKSFIDDNFDWVEEHKNSSVVTLWSVEYCGDCDIDKLYREEIEVETWKIFDECVEIVGRRPSEIKFRKMKNWGNCKKNGVITLNTKLASNDKEALKMVLIHELCHLIEFNHTEKFWSLMDDFCPNHREIRAKLNNNEN